MPDGESFEVVPDALRNMVKVLDQAAKDWKDMISALKDLDMKHDDLGAIGKEAEYPKSYKTVRGNVEDKLNDGTHVLEDTSDTLNDVAKHYEAKDGEWYEKFGYSPELRPTPAPTTQDPNANYYV